MLARKVLKLKWDEEERYEMMKTMMQASVVILMLLSFRAAAVSAQNEVLDSLMPQRSSQIDSVPVSDSSELSNFAVHQNFPNPFQISTTIEFVLPSKSVVDLVIFDRYGRKVKTLVNYALGRGRYRVVWDRRDETGTKVSPGIYYFQIGSRQHLGAHRMLVVQ